MVKVAAVQFRPEFKAKSQNIRRMISLVVSAARQGAKLIVLPELATTGYSFMSADEARPYADVLTQAAIHPDSASVYLMNTLARKLGVHIVWGTLERDYPSGKLYNAQVYSGPSMQESYRKMNRWGNDFLWAERGRANPPIITVEVEGRPIRIGLIICRDIIDKRDDDKGLQFYTKGDADVVCMSANWGDGGFPAVSWMRFVEDTESTLIVANRYGQESCNDFGEGGSCIIRSDGTVVCEGLVFSQDCIVYANI